MACRLRIGATVPFVLAMAVNAQTWNVTASAPVAGFADASVTSNYAPPAVVSALLAVGPIAPGEFLAAHATSQPGGWARADIEWLPTFPGVVGPVGFEVDVEATVLVSSPSGMTHTAAMCSSAATLLVMLQAPAPTSGRLVIDYDGFENDLGQAQVGVDIGDDGTIDLAAHSNLFPKGVSWLTADWSAHISTAGLPIRLHITSWSGVGVWGGQWTAHGAGMTLRCQFLPGQPIVDYFDTTGASAQLMRSHSTANVVTLDSWTPGAVLPSVFVFGTQSMVAPVPGLPTVTQLVSIDAIAVANQLTLPMPALPPGTVLYCQGLVVDSAGTLRSTNSLRATWP